MRLKIKLKSKKKILLPTGYNHLIQAFIYKHLGEKSNWLHEEGYKHHKRRFKLFCYSGILERGRLLRAENKFLFPHEISFYFSSPVQWIIDNIGTNTILNHDLHLGENQLTIESINRVTMEKITSEAIRVRTRSPIETHSTFQTAAGKKKTYYYTPFESEFSDLINKNLRKKWESYHAEDCPYNIKIKPKFDKNKKETIINYGSDNPTVVKAWHGHFLLNGNPEFLAFALDAGLGARNSQGFGNIELVKNKEPKK